jgi:hypothetical protein
MVADSQSRSLTARDRELSRIRCSHVFENDHFGEELELPIFFSIVL